MNRVGDEIESSLTFIVLEMDRWHSAVIIPRLALVGLYFKVARMMPVVTEASAAFSEWLLARFRDA